MFGVSIRFGLWFELYGQKVDLFTDQNGSPESVGEGALMSGTVIEPEMMA